MKLFVLFNLVHKNKLSIVFIISCAFLCYQTSFAQTVYRESQYRRHIIVAIDGSGSFLSKSNYQIQRCRDSVESFLNMLFSNHFDSRVNQRVISDITTGNLFYDNKNDKISFFQFYMSGEERKKIVHRTLISNPTNYPYFAKDVIQALIHPLDTLEPESSKNWKSLLHSYLNANYESGRITLSNYVFPLVMNAVEGTGTAEEYVLVFISDFMAGSFGSSRMDKNILLRDVFANQDSYAKKFTNYLDELRYYFYRIDYFDYAPETKDALPSCYGYRIKPKVGIGSSETLSLTIESDLGVKEKRRNVFQIKPIKIKFIHNNIVKVYGLTMRVLDDYGNIIYEEPVVEEKYDGDYITIPHTTIKSDKIKDLKLMHLRLSVMTGLESKNVPDVHYTFNVERDLSSSEISFINHTKRRRMIITITIFALLAVTALLIVLGRRKKIKKINIGKFAQRYEMVSKEEGAMVLPCWFYVNGQNNQSIKVYGSLEKAIPFSISGRTKLYARLQNPKPSGKELSYYIGNHSANNCEEILVSSNLGKFGFNISITVDPSKVNIAKVLECSIKLDFIVRTDIIGITLYEEVIDAETIRYFFTHHLGNAWVGFDPGTSGSSVAIGCTGGTLSNPNIELIREHVANGSTIIPSRLAFDKPLSQQAVINFQLIPGEDYKYGSEVEQSLVAYNRKGIPNFQSIKKLIGYKNTESDYIHFHPGGESNTEVNMTGVKMAHLLVKGLHTEMAKHIDSLNTADRARLTGEKEGMPRRAVVAIPNNYTLPKTLDMVNSIRMLNRFDEIRYIFEAEGILFNYFRKYINNAHPDRENIMVFDMGGATINISIFSVIYRKEGGNTLYDVQTLGRIGYAVGGDNIDVALMEYIFSHHLQNRHTEAERRIYETQHRTEILKGILELKKVIIKSHSSNFKDNSHLDNQVLFSNFINSILGSYDRLTDDAYTYTGQLHYSQAISNNIINSQEMKSFVYSNITDAVSEILDFPGVIGISKIDKVVFGGRSTLFPNVKNTVKSALNARKMEYKIAGGFSDSEIKTGVAYGACWYGIYNSLVRLDNSKLPSSYGFKHTSDGKSKLNVVLEQNSAFDNNGTIAREVTISSNFASDGNVADFYQLMGCHTDESIFEEKNRHKLNYIGRLDVTTTTESIEMSITRQNIVSCSVTFNTGNKVSLNEINVTGRDITIENDWAYVFSTLQ